MGTESSFVAALMYMATGPVYTKAAEVSKDYKIMIEIGWVCKTEPFALWLLNRYGRKVADNYCPDFSVPTNIHRCVDNEVDLTKIQLPYYSYGVSIDKFLVSGTSCFIPLCLLQM